MEQDLQNLLILNSSLGVSCQRSTQKKRKEKKWNGRTVSNESNINISNSISIRTKIELVLNDQTQGNRLSKFCIAIIWDLMKLLRTVSDHVSRSMCRKVNMEQF